MHPLVMEHEHVVRSDAKYNDNDKEMQLAKVVNLEDVLVDDQGNRNAEEYLNDDCDADEKAANVEADEDE